MAKQKNQRQTVKPKKQGGKGAPGKEKKTALLRDEGLEARILEHLTAQQRPQSLEEIATALRISATVVQKLLKSMVRMGQVAKTRKQTFGLPQQLGLLPGKVQRGADGNYTFIAEGGAARFPVLRGTLRGALHGDAVWAREAGGGMVQVERVLQRANETIVGTLRRQGRKAYLVPDNRRLPARIPLAVGQLMEARDGDLVVARVLTFEDEGELRATVQQRLGEADQIRSAMYAIIYQNGFELNFDEKVQAQAQLVAQQDLAGEVGERLDLREARIFTIDGADAQDFDDAVSIEALSGGVQRLGVHIADVSYYVRNGSLLDEEAQNRGTSVYLPGMVLPMLPEALSNGSCSLRPDEDRLTLSVLMDVSAQGEVLRYGIKQTVIRSRARLIYDDVNALLAGEEPQVEGLVDLLPDLSAMAALSAVLRAHRYARGSLDFDVEEAQITVDAQGEPVEIAQRSRGISHRMIEDFMILANETVAKHAKERELPFLYRVHEKPDPEKMEAFQAFLANVGLRVKAGQDHITPKSLQGLLEEAEGRDDYPVIAQLMIRSMQKALYSPEPIGHFGLAAVDYCHFTSPIRRYPDLWIHRILTAEAKGELPRIRGAAQAQVQAVASHASARERSAMEAERAADKLMMARYMLRHIGEEFQGVIVNIVEWGFYVALPNTIEGLVHVRTLRDDYSMDGKHLTLVGSRTGTIFRIGQSVEVRVEKVDVTARQIDFTLIQEMP